jgi:predicted amidohydrolase YtcJ
MKKLLLLPILLLFSCAPKQEWVDLIVYNANIYTVDSTFSVKQSMAINGGKIVAVGTDEEIKTKYNSSTLLDAGQKTIFPGFIDAHCHFLGYGLGLQRADLTGTKSFEEVLHRLPSPTEESLRNGSWIVGRGWDQNDWDNKEYPTNEKLNALYPNTPVFLKRIDGHAALVNETALRLAGINEKTKINGGELILKDGKLTGVLIDNAVDLVSKVIPPPSKEQIQKALLAAQKNCFAVGLTTVDDAGLLKNEIDIIDELQKKGDLQMRIYAMLSDDTLNYAYYLKAGPYKTDKLNVRSFKFYADGALGSRGACLLQDYTDKKNWKGFLLSDPQHFAKYATLLFEKGFQMNTHCIGDSAYRMIMEVYIPLLFNQEKQDIKWPNPRNYVPEKFNRRWRIEHCQVVDRVNYYEGINYFDGNGFHAGIIPSVQPTHATSDMYWAEERLGKERVKYAYAYKDLLNAAGMVALGTDFPVEDISPFKTFYAAVERKDSKGFPQGGFQFENALSREETIKGMTIWAAYSNFEEKEKGSLEPGKFADFIILDKDLMKCKPQEILKTKVLSTYLGGQMVFEKK